MTTGHCKIARVITLWRYCTTNNRRFEWCWSTRAWL